MDCPICNCKISREFIVDLQICTMCNHIFKIKKVKRETYEIYESSAHLKLNDIFVRNAMYSSKYRLKLLQTFKDSGKLLEIGSGHRYFLDEANKAGYEVEATELSKSMIEKIPEYKFYYGNPSEIDKLQMYDCIVGFHVLEHINDPIKELQELVIHLRPKGIMMFEIPFLSFYGTSITPDDIYEGLHTQYFNQISLIKMLDRVGLKILYQSTFWDSEKKHNTLFTCCRKEDFNLYRNKGFKYMHGEEL